METGVPLTKKEKMRNDPREMQGGWAWDEGKFVEPVR